MTLCRLELLIWTSFWGFLYYQHRQDILAVQNYITAILVFLVVEMLMTWGFYGEPNPVPLPVPQFHH